MALINTPWTSSMVSPYRASASRFGTMSTKKPPAARSAKMLRVPGTLRSAVSSFSPMRWIWSRFAPRTLMPTGVRTPVVSMSMRPLIGIVQALTLPGIWSAESISEINFSQVRPGRHCDFGFSWTTVSIIEKGAGSVAVSARPALPWTLRTSGNDLSVRSCVCISRAASVTEIPGKVVGMYRIVPSLSGGMNSWPSFR